MIIVKKTLIYYAIRSNSSKIKIGPRIVQILVRLNHGVNYVGLYFVLKIITNNIYVLVLPISELKLKYIA